MVHTPLTPSQAREAKRTAWAAGAEAFADFVQRAAQRRVEENPDKPLADDEFLALVQRWLQHGLAHVLDLNPFEAPDYDPKDLDRINRVVRKGTPTATG